MKHLQILLGLLFFPMLGYAQAETTHIDPVSPVIFWVTLIFLFGVIGRYIAIRLRQPGVLGELLMGILMGNVCYFLNVQLAVILREGSAIYAIMRELLTGVSLTQAVNHVLPNPHYAEQVNAVLKSGQGIELIKVSYIVDIFSRYGVIFLLFMVGLESSATEIRHHGVESFRVAMIGVFAPILLSLLISMTFVPNASFNVHLFIAATLSATSVGITARVLKDMKKIRTHEAQTILGAAMIDDVLGLIILAIVSSLVLNGDISFLVIGKIVLFALSFFLIALWMGPFALQKAIKFFSFLEPWEAKLCVTFLFVMTLAWLASIVQLATIIGAFAAGVIIRDGYFVENSDKHIVNFKIKDLISPLETLLAPLFFMLIGIQVKIETFLDLHVLLMASGLCTAAILGKLICGLGGQRKYDRLLIGIGMLPRGEVGLIFASIGKTLGVITDNIFSAIIIMVIITTLIAPPWLKHRYARHDA